MKSFHCQVCGQLIFFENAQCLRCLNTLGYLPELEVMSALEGTGNGLWRAIAQEAGAGLYKSCRNSLDWHACNWMLPANSDFEYCLSCRLNKTIPDLSEPANLDYWRKLEQGKRRLIYSLMRLGLPVVAKRQEDDDGLAFEFLRTVDVPMLDEDEPPVMTGHKNGMITVNVTEADDLERERIRLHLNEMYRSVLGHFRHESGHYYWQRLISNSPQLSQFRALFGDETQDYQTALKSYYKQGPVSRWQSSFISAYASSHPWEDWAESWAHYLTIVDALETASHFGVVVSIERSHNLFPPVDSYRTASFDEMLNQWLPLTYAVNSINRSAGHHDLYPFVLPPPAVAKLQFVHQVIKAAAGQ